MQLKSLLQKFGILVALLTFSATLFGGVNSAAQEPEVVGTPLAETIEIPGEGVTTLPPEDCTFSILNEGVPFEAEPITTEGNSNITIEVDVYIDNNGEVTVESGGADLKPFGANDATGVVGTDPKTFSTDSVTNGTVPDLALVEAGCSSAAVEYPDASPTDPNIEGVVEANPSPEQPETDPGCTIVKETKLADGTTEKTLSCPAT